MKLRLSLFMILFWAGTEIRSQAVLDWSDLSEGISWELPAPGAIFPGFQKANFSSEIRALEGKEVIITGYLLILDAQQTVFLLSKNPMASCFFCGNGGPETVVDLQFYEKPPFEMDELLSVRGILRLNRDNPNASYFKIEKADAISFK